MTQEQRLEWIKLRVVLLGTIQAAEARFGAEDAAPVRENLTKAIQAIDARLVPEGR